MLRIAAEEAWAPPDILDRYRKLIEEKPANWDPGFCSGQVPLDLEAYMQSAPHFNQAP